MKTIKCHNNLHLGDCIESLHFLTNSADLNGVEFVFACKEEYHKQLLELLKYHSDKIKLVSNKQLDSDSIDTWIAGYGDYGKLNEKSVELNGYLDQATSFLLHWIRVADLMSIKVPFTTKHDLIYNQQILAEESIDTNKYDYLFINSIPMSGQCTTYSVQEMSRLLRKILSKNKTIITTMKIEGLPCTLDRGMTVVEIGKLSKNVKNIIAVNTGPLHLCMNKWSLSNINNFVIWSTAETFNYGSFFKTVKSLGEIDESSI